MPRICIPGELSGKYRCWITLGSGFVNWDLGFVEDCWQQDFIVSGEGVCVPKNVLHVYVPRICIPGELSGKYRCWSEFQVWLGVSMHLFLYIYMVAVI